MPNLNIDLTPMNYRLLTLHKSLVEADTWDDYVNKACMKYPMKAKKYGEHLPFSLPPPKREHNRKVTMRMSAATHVKADRIRFNLGYTWREFFLYPSQNDGVQRILNTWSIDSVLGREVAKND